MEVLYGRSSEAAIFSRALQLSVSKSDIIKKVNSERFVQRFSLFNVKMN